MARISKSQWEFDGLFPSEPARKVLTVSELTWQVRRLLEQQVGEVWVTGEITNRRLQSSGHIYFTLKDAGAQLSCVLFRGETQADRALVQDGRKVNLRGEVTVYEPRGQYQLRVMKVELQGVGALQAAFEKLKQKLKAEGLFAPERKRPLPRYPLRIGVATSPTGAALRDVLHVVERRHPALELILAPCRVQGEGAAAEIAAAVRLLNEFNRAAAAAGDRSGGVDLILVTRGGGSLEDLWAFNEEVVARAIFESALPVVSAVGHEIDFSISDFVADVRAATPSAAAEIITEGVFASGQFLSEAPRRLRQSAAEQWEDKRRDWAEAAQRLARMHPRRRLNDWLQRLDDAQTGLLPGLRSGMRPTAAGSQPGGTAVAGPSGGALAAKRDGVHLAEQRLREQGRRLLEARRAQLDALAARLRLLGPEQVLARGYSITSDAARGKVLRAADEVKPGQRLRTRLKTGEILSQAEG